MKIFNNPSEILQQRVQVQIKDPDGKQSSKSFTLKDVSVDEVYNRVNFLFEQLAKADGSVKIVHYKRRDENVQE